MLVAMEATARRRLASPGSTPDKPPSDAVSPLVQMAGRLLLLSVDL